jgi:predicted small secreted protein
MGIHLIPRGITPELETWDPFGVAASRALGDWEIAMKTAFAALAFLLAAAAAACNTVQGVGKDVTAAGTAIDDAAEDAKK